MIAQTAEIAMQPNRNYDVYDDDNSESPQENADIFEDTPPKHTVLVLIAKNVIILGSAAIMIFFFVMTVKYFF